MVHCMTSEIHCNVKTLVDKMQQKIVVRKFKKAVLNLGLELHVRYLSNMVYVHINCGWIGYFLESDKIYCP